MNTCNVTEKSPVFPEAEKSEDTGEIKRFLEEYLLCRRMLRMNRYEKEYFGKDDFDGDILGDEVLLKSKMFRIRNFIMSMENGNERLLLYYHYIRGESVEKCAELLGISRRSGFRLKQKALLLAKQKAFLLTKQKR